MVEIQPINNPDDILAEAQSVTPQVVTDTTTVPSTQADLGNPYQVPQPEYPVPHTTQDSSPQIPSKPLHEPTGVGAAEHRELHNEPQFSYRLPVFSYVLAWLFLIIVALSVPSLVQSVASYSAAVNRYEADIANYSNKANQDSVGANLTNSLYQGLIDSTKEQKATYDASFQKTMMSGLIKIAVGIALIVFLLSGKRSLKYGAIGVATLAAAYQIYVLVELISSRKDTFGVAADSLTLVYVNAYLPLILLLLATVVYLISPKAHRAYV